MAAGIADIADESDLANMSYLAIVDTSRLPTDMMRVFAEHADIVEAESVGVRRCKHCNAVLERKFAAEPYPHPEAITNFEQRQFCDVKCCGAYRKAQAQAINPLPEVRCQYCNELIPKAVNVSRKNHGKRKFCSSFCQRGQTGPIPKPKAPALPTRKEFRSCNARRCLCCAELLVRRANEKRGKFESRKYCSRQCARSSQPNRRKGEPRELKREGRIWISAWDTLGMECVRRIIRSACEQPLLPFTFLAAKCCVTVKQIASILQPLAPQLKPILAMQGFDKTHAIAHFCWRISERDE